MMIYKEIVKKDTTNKNLIFPSIDAEMLTMAMKHGLKPAGVNSRNVSVNKVQR